ncbi:hypothetical protein PMSD_14980 [Paenibacillus macquariensis subsp. defensor]|nr:hypothetical protein PMSD_14980 [Paenibacillus macquariensis subsp. defensor]
MIIFYTVLEKMLFLFKFFGYLYLAFLVYADFIGPEQFAYLLDVKEVSEEGVKLGAIILSKQLIFVTIGVGIMEAASNFVSLFKRDNN